MNNENNVDNMNTQIIEIPNENPAIDSSRPVMNLQNMSTTNEENKVVSEGFDKVNNSFYEKDKKVWPIFLLIIVLAIVGFCCYYYFILTKPINIIKKTLNSFYNNIEKELKDYDIAEEINTITANLNLIYSSNNEEMKDLSGIAANVSVGYDFKDKNKNIVDLSLEMNKEKMVDMSMSSINNNTYLDFKDQYSKIIYLENSGFFDLDIFTGDNNTNNQYLHLLKVLKDAFVNNISQDKLSKKILIKDVEGKKVPAIEVYYIIDYPEYKKLHNGIIDKLLSDSESVSILAKLSGSSESDIKEELEYEKNDISELDLTSDLKVTITIDAFTNKLIELVIADDNSKLVATATDNEINIDLTVNKDSISITIDKNESKLFADVKMEDNFRFSITSKYEEVSKKEIDLTATLILYDSEDINKEADTITGNLKIKADADIKPLDITNAVNFNDLSKSEQEKVSNLLLGLTGLLSFSE